MKKLITMTLALGLTTLLIAEANMPMDKNVMKTKEDMKADIEALIDIKRTITNGHIDALNTLGKILTKEQYQQILEFIATNKEKDKH